MSILCHVTGVLLLCVAIGCAQQFSDEPAALVNGDESVSPAREKKEKPWGIVVAGLQSRIWFENDRTTFAKGEKIIVRFAIRNVSNQNQTILVRGFWPNHRVDVFKGKLDAPLTKEGSAVRKLFGMGGTEEKTAPRIVKPQSVVESFRPIDLTKLFDLSEPGEYRVRITFQDSEAVPSNDLVFVVE